MTCIAARITDGIVYMAADSCGTTNIHRILTEPKFIEYPTALVGFSGELRILQLIERVPFTNISDWAEACRRAIREGGKLCNNEGKEYANFECIVATKDGLYTFCCDFATIKHAYDYTATGSGQEIALGALWAGATAEDSVLAACEFAPGVKAPIHTRIIKFDRNKLRHIK